MNPIRIEATIQVDGELHLTELPYRRGDRVEAIVLGVDRQPQIAPDEDRESTRRVAVERYLALAKSSAFCSTGPCPTRDELYERP